MTQDFSSDDVIVNQDASDDVIINDGASGDDIATDTSVTDAIRSNDDGRNWKNEYKELERKFNNTVDRIPTIIEETLGKQKAQEQKPSHSIEDLERYLMQDGLEDEAKVWARQQIRSLERQALLQEIEARDAKTKQEYEAQMVRRQTEQAVISNPRFQEAFITLPDGTKQWNLNSTLSKLIGQYYNSQDLKNRPDGLMIAAKLAYADYHDPSNNGARQQMSTLKRQNEQLKKQTLVEGGGRVVQSKEADPYEQAAQKFRETRRVDDLAGAIGAYRQKLMRK